MKVKVLTFLVTFVITVAAVFQTQVTFAQVSSTSSAQQIAQQYLQLNAKDFGLSSTDIADVLVTDAYQTKHNQLTHVWLMQRYQGIPVFNGLLGLHVAPNGKVYHLAHRFVQELASRANTTLPSLSGDQALMVAMQHLGFDGFNLPSLKQKIDQRFLIFEGGAISKSDIPVSACFVALPDNQVRLAWMLQINQANTSDSWSIRVDAQTGEILGKNNRTVYCKHEKDSNHQHDSGCLDNPKSTSDVAIKHETTQKTAEGLNAVPSYNVFPFPTESPAHGPRQLVVNPANAIASPLGWHDTNGIPGAEYTYTRGNNVHAYDDREDSDMPPSVPIPNAGATLVFDFPYDANAEPTENLQSAITNLFYTNNAVHDILYQYGFDEEAGNFQSNNYNNGGEDTDQVLAEGLDGSGVDNANFATPPDGANGRMQMYVWNRNSGNVVTVNSPGSITGTYPAGTCNWNTATMVTATGVTANVALMNDGSADPTFGCGTPNSLTGKIAIIDRGGCQFGVKAKKAEQAGAVGCIICNFDDGDLAFAAGTAGTTGTTVTIPVVGMKKNQCDLLKSYINSGLNISLKQPSVLGPDQLDGDFDNGIIAHEYGHGVSNRLTGGPAQADCLNNPEQMGEGWSDLLALFLTHRPGDMAITSRGVGTYVKRQPSTGQGVRNYPYNTDMSINPLIFSDVAANAEVHALGAVWAAVVWDMYWALIDKYGYNPDIYNGNGGNNRAIQLVIDGMKLQPCNPGFIDGRDAILLANVLNNNGEDTCLIQSVFARRGFGYLASQGLTSNASDGVENFEPRQVCIKTIKIKKECTPFVQAGDNVTVTISVRNDKDGAATNVVLNDELPQGLIYNAGSANENGTSSGSMITWNIGTLAAGAIKTYTYTATADPAKKSLLLFKDAMDNDDNWIAEQLEGDGTVAFNTQTVQKIEGTGAYFVNSATTENDVSLWFAQNTTISGNRPVMRFWYNSNTEAGSDAAFLEFSIDEGTTFPFRLDVNKCLRNPYTKVQYGTFAIPFLYGISGNSSGWKRAYIDISQFAGQTVQFRYRFGTDDNTNGGPGIYFDDTQIIDMINYDGQACITTAQGDNLCAKAPESGVIVDSDATIATDEPNGVSQFGVRLYPNPASQTLTIMPDLDLTGNVQLNIYSADGRIALSRNYAQLLANNTQQLDVSRLPSGFYTVQVVAAQGRSIQKLVKK